MNKYITTKVSPQIMATETKQDMWNLTHIIKHYMKENQEGKHGYGLYFQGELLVDFGSFKKGAMCHACLDLDNKLTVESYGVVQVFVPIWTPLN